MIKNKKKVIVIGQSGLDITDTKNIKRLQKEILELFYS